MSFRMLVRESRILVTVEQNKAEYTLLAGPPIDLAHHGEAFTLSDDPQSFPIERITAGDPPEAPIGCAPYRRER